MIVPTFTFNEEANGYLSEPFTIDKQVTVHIELDSMAPVVVLKQEEDGEYDKYGQTPKETDMYELEITSNEQVTLILATPVGVRKCYIMN